MLQEKVERILTDLDEIKKRVGEKQAKALDIEQLERVIKRLASFADVCKECETHLGDLKLEIEQLTQRQEQFEKLMFKELLHKKNGAIAHLQKEHKLVTENYYMSIYMSIGMSFGLIFGMLLLDNLALGLPIGLSIGLAIGVGMDADAKKKGLTI
ncbi:hypothetical protein [Desulfuribacillus alkaliarsenatis]|uniref:Glycine zipper-like domain-containing protein n=1 Tax=Desulfuribacillus alkaliarsenatis TaxID=766136 RepID=A0A1E5G2E4_9FIRM|nr:hypothetical protein [Desulfuribacillus alkaliarsenatis]OEF97168.1 hypothetical protein BHF68_06110 [Desulfuribacillus alkaliarsenatis]